MKRCLCLILFASFSLISAIGSEPDLRDLSFVEEHTLADERTSLFYESNEPLNGALSLSGYSGESVYQISHLMLKKESWAIKGAFRHQEESVYNAQIRYRDALVLGAFRPAWGNGLVFSFAERAPALRDPPHPQTYSPSGLGVNLTYKDLGLLAMVSGQERGIKISEDSISSMSRTKLPRLSQAEERIGSLGMYLQQKSLGFGALAYYQEYDRAFADSQLDSIITIASLYSVYQHAQHKLRVEYAIQDKGTAFKAEWDLGVDSFTSKVLYSRLGEYQRPAYAQKTMLLSSLDEREEISVQLGYRPGRNVRLRAGTTLNRRRGDIGDPDWLSNSLLRADYREADTILGIGLRLIDREILVATDSSYACTRPVHYRLQLGGSYRVNSTLSTELSARYHYQEKHLALNSGAFWAQHLVIVVGSIKLKAGFATVSSANHKLLVVSDNDLGYEVWGRSGTSGLLECHCRRKQMELSLKLKQELEASGKTTLSLGFSTQFKAQK